MKFVSRHSPSRSATIGCSPRRVRSSTGSRFAPGASAPPVFPEGWKVNQLDRSSEPARRTATATRSSGAGSVPRDSRIFSAERSGSSSGAWPAVT